MSHPTPLRLAVVGAGPAGLALALLAADLLPQAQVTVYDARDADRDVRADPRALAMALGSIQVLQRLQAWPAEVTEAITRVHVSQAPPSWPGAELSLSAAELQVPQLGAVVRYGQLVATLQERWMQRVQAEPGRLGLRLGQPVQGLQNLAQAVEVDAGVLDTADLAVVAEGGVFADQARKGLRVDYRQTAWVGTVDLQGLAPGLAVERFTAEGPVALLPLPRPAVACATASADSAAVQSAALVWCVRRDDDPVAGLNPAQRLAVLQSRLPPFAGRVLGLSALKSFALGLNAERTLVDGRIVRIGNAAQTLHPVAGQGLNLGLRDAVSLVNALRSLRGPQDLQGALARVEWQRAPDRWSMMATTDFLARSFTWRAPGVGAARGLGLRALAALPGARRLLARQMMFGWR